MAEYKAFDPNAESNGAGLSALLAVLSWNEPLVLEILSKHGIKEVRMDGWYPHQAVLDVQKEIAQTMGVHTLYQIGTKIPEKATFPPEIDSLEKGLALLDQAYHMNHRGGEIGHYQLVKVENNQALMVCNNPYSCDFDRGIIVATARHFAGTVGFVNLRHDESAGCRKLGGESCTYIIEWLLLKPKT
jgi:hypothetical protein